VTREARSHNATECKSTQSNRQKACPWIESDALTVFGLPPRDPHDDDDNEGEEEDDKGEDNEPPVVREPDRVDYAGEPTNGAGLGDTDDTKKVGSDIFGLSDKSIFYYEALINVAAPDLADRGSQSEGNSLN